MEIITLFFSSLWVFLRPFILQLLTEGGILLAKYAMEAVTKVASTMSEADGAAKRDEAFKIIADQLAKEGVQIATSTINAAIEAAVVKLKDDTKPVAPTV